MSPELEQWFNYLPRIIYLDAALSGYIRGVPADLAGRVDIQLERTWARLHQPPR